MEEQKGPNRAGLRQMTLDHYDISEGVDLDNDALPSHLIEEEDQPKDNNQWTGVFTRDSLGDNQIPAIPLGPELIYNGSVRESSRNTTDYTDEVLFAPFLFTA